MARVLVVDDELGVLQLLSRGLEARGHDVLAAPHPRMALELVRGNRFPGIDLIVSDVIMPEISGPDLVREIAKDLPGVPAIFISGLTAGEKLPEGAAFLRKPFSLSELTSKVDAMLEAGVSRKHFDRAIRDCFDEILRLHAELGNPGGCADRRDLEEQASQAQLRLSEILSRIAHVKHSSYGRR